MSEGKYFYSKGEGNDGYIKNLEVLGYCEELHLLQDLKV